MQGKINKKSTKKLLTIDTTMQLKFSSVGYLNDTIVFDTSDSLPPSTGFDFEKIQGYQLSIEYLKDNNTVYKAKTNEKYYSVAGINLKLKHRYTQVKNLNV